MPMHGKVILVTGAASAFGQAVVGSFAEQGSMVYGADLVSPLPTLPFGVEGLRLDVTSERAWAKAIADIVDETGRLDVLVNQAGIVRDGPSGPWDLGLWMKQLAMDLAGMCLGMSVVIPLMLEQGAGSIINISSAWGGWAAGADLARHAAKGAVQTLSRSAATTYAAKGIHINSMHAGLGVTRTPTDIARGCLFLASRDAAGLTGGELVFGDQLGA
jgi:3alpha(or 20beta)-hydroxysteroid dehydrogenase